MHAIKGGWARQTFALAKHNESEGKRTRIRRSKEERKEMVESFIKKYQKLNNGNFPSLNLTHKEVGGSFYTVREIVRDIIQENRVLGPAKFSSEEQCSYQFLEQDPLGSIAIDPQTSNEKLLERNNIHHAIEETHVSDGHYTRTEHHMVDNGLLINGSQVDVRTNNSTEASAPELLINELPAPEQIIEQELTTPIANVTPATPAPKQIIEQELTTPIAKVTPATPDVIVETFPLRPVTRTSNRIGDDSEEYVDLNDNAEQEIQMLASEEGKERSKLNSHDESMKNSNSIGEKFEDDNGTGDIKTSRNSGFVDEKGEKNLGNTLVEISKQTSHEEYVGHAIEGHTGPQDRAPHQSVITATSIEQHQILAGSERASVQSGFDAKNLPNNHAEESKTTEKGLKNVNEYNSKGQLGGCSQRRNNSTLDRINLESWDGAPKNSAKQAANPIVAIFKAFVDAFVKFWSE